MGLTLVFFTGSAHALSLTYNGSILKPDGTPLSGSVAFSVSVKSAAGCVIYRETQTATVTSGAFALALNSGSSTLVHGSSSIFDAAFTNAGTFSCEGGGTFTPGASATRVLGVTFTPPAAATETLPDQAINAVPSAAESMNAAAVGGFPTSSLLRVASGTTPGTAAALTAAQFTEILNLAAGSSTRYVQSSTTVGAPAPPVSTGTGAPGSAVAGSIWFNTSTNRLMYYDGSQAVTLSGSTSASGVTSVTAGTGIATTGTSGAITLSLATSGVTAGSYTKLTVDAYGRATSGSTLTQTDLPTITTAGKVSGSAITSGTIGGTTSLVTSGSVTAGTVTAPLVSGTAMSTRQVAVYNPAGTFATTLSSSTLLASNLSFVLPSTAGTVNQVLATDGAGNLSWATTSSGTGGGSTQWVTTGTNISYSSGNVGIGTSSPYTALQVYRANNESVSIVISDNTSSTTSRYPAVQALNYGGVTGGGIGNPEFNLINMRGNSGTSAVIRNGDSLGSLSFNGSTDSASNYSIGAAIWATATQDFSPTQSGSDLTFWTTPNGSIITTQKMIVDQSGNVGIGISSPATRLDVVGQAAWIRGTGTTPGELRFGPGPTTGSNYVGFRAPASNPASNVLWTLPAADGTANQVLLTNGAGTLSWATVSGGTGGGISSFNGLSAGAQGLLTPTTTGTLMSWTSSGTAHTLNLPAASGTTPFGLLTSADWTSFNAKITGVSGSTLTSGNLWVGNGSNLAASVAISGDATLSNAGVLAISAGSVTGTELATAAANATTKILSVSPGAGYLLSTDFVTGSTISALGSGCVAGQTIVWSASGFACAPSHTFNTGVHTIARQSAAASGGALLTLTSNNATNSVSLRAPDALGSSLTLVLPSTTGTANQILSTDGSGNLSWATASGGGSNATQLQGRTVDASAPTSGHVLSWNGSSWTPASVGTFPFNSASINSNLIPDAGGIRTLGTLGVPWGSSFFGAVTAAGDVLPSNTTSYRLGNSSYRWLDIYGLNYFGATAAFTGNVSVGGILTAPLGATSLSNYPDNIIPDAGGVRTLGTSGRPFSMAYVTGLSTAADITPTLTNSFKLGNSSNVWNEIYGASYFGTNATLSNNLSVGGTITGTLGGSSLGAFAGDIIPNTNGTRTLGSSGFPWGAAYLGAISANGHVTPSQNNSFNLGSSSFVWNSIYGASYFGTTATLTGNLSVGGTISGTLGGSSLGAFAGNIIPDSSGTRTLGTSGVRWGSTFVGALDTAGSVTPSLSGSFNLGSGSNLWLTVFAQNGTINTSDRRLKTDIRDSELGLDFVRKLRPVRYRWASSSDTGSHYGLIAQELEQVLAESAVESGQRKPAMVNYDVKADRYGVIYTELIGPLVKAVQELFAKGEATDRKAALQEAEVAALRAQVEELRMIVCTDHPGARVCDRAP